MCVYNPIAIDYRKGVKITDYKTNKVYSEEEALLQSQEVKSRLICKPVKIGCWVMDLHELYCKECQKLRLEVLK